MWGFFLTYSFSLFYLGDISDVSRGNGNAPDACVCSVTVFYLLEVNARPSLFVLKSRCGSMAVKKKKKQSESESKMSSQIHIVHIMAGNYLWNNHWNECLVANVSQLLVRTVGNREAELLFLCHMFLLTTFSLLLMTPALGFGAQLCCQSLSLCFFLFLSYLSLYSSLALLPLKGH